MPLVDNAWYVNYGDGSTTGYYSITKWAAATTYSAGAIRRQNTTPAVGSERVFICIVAGTSHATTEPTWTLTRGAKTTDNTVTWQEVSGQASLNGDATNTPSWTTLKNTAIVLGQIIKRNNGASYQICTTAGTAGNGSEPAFSDTAGTTTTDNAVTWTSLGVVGDYTGWQAPIPRLANAFTSTWGGAGDVFFVASEHAETQAAAMTITAPGTAAIPSYVYCVTKTTVPPASANLTTGATVTTTGNSSLTVGASGACHWHGLTFSAGSGAVAAQLIVGGGVTSQSFKACSLVKAGTSSSSVAVQIGNSGVNTDSSRIIFDNTTLSFGHAGDSIRMYPSLFTWVDTANAINGGTTPSALFGSATSTCSVVLFEGVDLSALGSGKIIFGASGAVNATLKNCKLGSSVTVSATPTSPTRQIIVSNADSSGTNYRHEKYAYAGTQTVETTIVRTGGASDGTTSIAWKIETTANSKWLFPFESMPIAIWNDTTAANVTVTVYGIWGGGAVPNNDEIWIEVSYMGSSATPIATINTSNTKADNLATGSALASDTSTWGGSTTKFKMEVTLSSPQPAMKGLIYVTVKAAKASSTFYVDPKIVLS